MSALSSAAPSTWPSDRRARAGNAPDGRLGDGDSDGDGDGRLGNGSELGNGSGLGTGSGLGSGLGDGSGRQRRRASTALHRHEAVDRPDGKPVSAQSKSGARAPDS